MHEPNPKPLNPNHTNIELKCAWGLVSHLRALQIEERKQAAPTRNDFGSLAGVVLMMKTQLLVFIVEPNTRP